MTRPLKPRLIKFEPGVTYFKPRGVPMWQLSEIILRHDEVEALRLRYVQDLEQIACARKMRISQSTFQRILARANKKISQALINGQAIRIEE